MNVAIILYLLLTLSSTILFATQLWQANRDRTMNNSRVIRRLRISAASMFALHLASAFFNYGGQPWQLPLALKDIIGVFVATWFIANLSQRLGYLIAEQQLDATPAQMQERHAKAPDIPPTSA